MTLLYIKSKILTDDHNEIFYDICNDYKKYGFINREYCKNYLLIIFSELFNKDVDLDIVDGMNKSDKILRIDQDKFREQIISRFKTCIISDVHHESCQASHIYDLKYDNSNYDSNNGLLLNATLHLEFDKLKWCIHPVTYEIVVSNRFQNQNLEINKYLNKDLRSKLEKYPDIQYYLHKKYQKFISIN